MTGPRDTLAQRIAADLETIHERALLDKAAIRAGRLPEFEALSPAARNQLAEEYAEQVGRTWREAQGRIRPLVEAAEQPRVVPPDPAAAPNRPSPSFGSPPVRRPPSTHGGGGWDNDW